MTELMPVEDIVSMRENTTRGQKARSTMLYEAYAPCMQAPIKEIVFNLCITNPETIQKMKRAVQTCQCMADVISRQVHQDRSNVVERVLYAEPDTTDVLGSFLNSKEFFDISRGWMKQCVRIHELGMHD